MDWGREAPIANGAISKAGSNGRVACSGKRVNPKHGGLCTLEYDTKSNFLHMDAQKDAQEICKALKISGYISPMLQPPFFRRKNFGLASQHGLPSQLFY